MSRTFPTRISDILNNDLEAVLGRRTRRPFFPFVSWAATNRFQYKEEAQLFLANTGSAAEAFFAREFTNRDGVEYCDRRAFTADRMLELQVRAGGYYIDAVVSDKTTSLAVEVDGLGFHHRSMEAVAQDYIRERRLVLKGYTVIRFTANEVFAKPHECWQQIDAILQNRSQK